MRRCRTSSAKTGLVLGIAGFVIILNVTKWHPKSEKLSKSLEHSMNFFNHSTSYKYIIMPDLSLCDGSRQKVDRFENRQAIRDSWASAQYSLSIKTGRVVTYFLLSEPNSIHDFLMVRKEQKKHNDLIVTSLTESYQNLVYKVYASIVFHQQYCPQTSFLIKIDDDVGIHIDRMLNLWNIDKNASMSLYGHLIENVLPIRDPNSKWFVSEHVWPNQHFPTYCAGSTYLMGRSAGRAILDEAKNFPPFEIEEFFNGSFKCNASQKPTLFAVHALETPDEMRRGCRILETDQCRYPE
ncbi:unnamed protein product [Angiostrongylus costaricensis]|uniref:Hexosyltransferase n=1 Tax=Angiostrongylus costaricensis TaxID=334426 RepID=A0A0R3PWP4_ANGCS|nr:unnamed protein product [Angiostrongylus costaricensis]